MVTLATTIIIHTFSNVLLLITTLQFVSLQRLHSADKNAINWLKQTVIKAFIKNTKSSFILKQIYKVAWNSLHHVLHEQQHRSSSSQLLWVLETQCHTMSVWLLHVRPSHGGQGRPAETPHTSPDVCSSMQTGSHHHWGLCSVDTTVVNVCASWHQPLRYNTAMFTQPLAAKLKNKPVSNVHKFSLLSSVLSNSHPFQD